MKTVQFLHKNYNLICGKLKLFTPQNEPLNPPLPTICSASQPSFEHNVEASFLVNSSVHGPPGLG